MVSCVGKIDARAAAMRQYAIDYERFAGEAQVLMGQGKTAKAAGVGIYAERILRAFHAESSGQLDSDFENPHPHTLAIPGCARCDAQMNMHHPEANEWR